MKKLVLVCTLAFLSPCIVSAETGGFGLNATRVIFDSEESSSKIKANNYTDKKWLLRAWVSSYGFSDKVDSFIITPPLYRIEAGESIQLKIDKLKDNFPQDRESIFHINVMAIPPIPKKGKEEGLVQFALNNRIKLIYRPHNINDTDKVSSAYKNLKVEKVKSEVKISNPTPYYITLDDVKINGGRVSSVKDFMIGPFSSLNIPERNILRLSYTTINDNGGKTPTVTVHL